MSSNYEHEHTNEHRDELRRREDVNAKARAAGTTPEKVKQGKTKMPAHGTIPPDQQSGAAPGQFDSENLEDGYSEIMGRGYDKGVQHPEHATEGSDPARSGAQPAPNKPGKRVDTPGREGENAWAEQLQMGRTTDTPERKKNPAN